MVVLVLALLLLVPILSRRSRITVILVRTARDVDDAPVGEAEEHNKDDNWKNTDQSPKPPRCPHRTFICRHCVLRYRNLKNKIEKLKFPSLSLSNLNLDLLFTLQLNVKAQSQKKEKIIPDFQLETETEKNILWTYLFLLILIDTCCFKRSYFVNDRNI